MKNKNKIIALLGCSLSLTALASCGGTKVDPKATLSYAAGEDGKYYIRYTRGGHEVNTNLASMGAMFGDPELPSLQAEGVTGNYTNVEKTDAGLIAKGSIVSKNGSEIEFVDAFSLVEEDDDAKVLVNRTFKVKSGSNLDNGFFVSQKWSQTDKFTINDKEWFVPASLYITGQHTFSNSSTRMYCGGGEFCVAADEVSALLVSSMREGFAFSMMDTTSGQRETISQECNTKSKTILNVSDKFNIPGIVVSCDMSSASAEDASLDDEGFVSYSHIYPAYQNRANENFNYRLLPLIEGLSRNISFTISLDEYDSYYELQREQWLYAYNHYAIEESRYTYSDVYANMINYLDRSHNWYPNTTGYGTPIYMDTAVHKNPDSGFLYRNIDFAYYMIKYGLSHNNNEMVKRASAVANDQIEYDRIDYTMYSYPRDYTCFKRALFDGLGNTVNLYALLMKYTSNPTDVNISKLYSYILQKAELYKNETSAMALTFYAQLVRYKNILNVDYTSTYQRLLDYVIKSTKDFAGYYGAIENQTNVRFSSMEDYMIILRALVNGYEIFSSQLYLDEAIRIANYLETYNQLQPINLLPIGATGQEKMKYGFMGNQRFLANGYAFNNTNHRIYDIADNSSAIEYYKLAKYTNNAHYEDFLNMKITNAFQYINMGDKVGYMDDAKMSSGANGVYGFMNEFAGVTVAKDSYADGGARGAVHDSVIGWNVYEVLSVLDYLKDINYSRMSSDDLNHELSTNKVLSINEDNNVHSVYNSTDEFNSTYYTASKETNFVMDLNEQCFVKSVSITGSNSVTYSISSDGVNYSQIPANGCKGRFIKFNVPANEHVNNISVIGHAVRYQDLAITASGSGMSGALDQSNYNTSWTPTSSSNVITLSSTSEIYEIAVKPYIENEFPIANSEQDNAAPNVTTLKYKVEVSEDGTNYVLYGQDDGTQAKFVFVHEKFAKARFVRITIDPTSYKAITDIKILGSNI